MLPSFKAKGDHKQPTKGRERKSRDKEQKLGQYQKQPKRIILKNKYKGPNHVALRAVVWHVSVHNDYFHRFGNGRNLGIYPFQLAH